MPFIDQRIDAIARVQDNVLTRGQVLETGGSDKLIAVRLARGLWQPLQAGVYLVGSAPPTWHQRLRGAVFAGGPDAEASHRAAILQWGLDGLASAPVEITMPFGHLALPELVIGHRSRRREERVYVGGIATSGVERALLEVGAVCPAIVVEKAVASAFRQGRSSPSKVDAYLRVHAGKGRRGARKLRDAMELYRDGGGTPGSGGEVVFLRELRLGGIEDPVRQLTIDLPGGGKATVDFAWPRRRKALEFVGWWTHSDARRQDDDTWREDDIRAVGWDLRRVAPWSLKHRPEALAASVLRFLCRDLTLVGSNSDTKR
jgi:hypothetical protein